MPRDDAPRLDPDDILKAYGLGYFPMARTRANDAVVWVLPDRRGCLPLDKARAPRRLLRTLKAEPFAVTANQDFAAVIAACAEATRGRPDTWINRPIEEAYLDLHRRGHAHSIECRRDGALVGGVYGVAVGAIFCGESMFSRARDASKVALLHLIARLRIARFALLDTQFWTPHLSQFGVEEWPDTDYQAALDAYVGEARDFAGAGDQLSARAVLQSITQTS